jgi:hypothetical protein
MHCKCTTYHPHSNECGPCTKLALHVLALHPTPNPEMLLPLMDANLAQIARLWVAASLINGEFRNDVFTYTFSLSQFCDTRIFNRASSIPLEYINTDTEVPAAMPQMHNIMPDESSSSLEYSQCSSTPTMDKHHPRISPPLRDRYSSLMAQTLTEHIPLHETYTSSPNISNNQVLFGSPLNFLDTSKTMQIVMQNTQYTFQLTNEDHNKFQAIEQLYNLNVSVFVAISLNVNWENSSHWVAFKRPFRRTYQQIQIMAVSSDIGKEPVHRNNPNLISGTAILSFNQWASKVCNTQTDPRGQGTYAVMTYQGKNGKNFPSLVPTYRFRKSLGLATILSTHSKQLSLNGRQ